MTQAHPPTASAGNGNGNGNGNGDSDRCPRCGGGFHCGVADAGPCACTTVQLSPTQLAALRRQYSGCLCLRCLAELSLAPPACEAAPQGPAAAA